MLQVGVIGVLGVLFAVQFKSGKSEYAVYISVAVSLLLFGCMLERLRDAVDSLGRIGNYIKVDQRFFGTMIKMIGITYLAEFSSGICKDAGYARRKQCFVSPGFCSRRNRFFAVSLPLGAGKYPKDRWADFQ